MGQECGCGLGCAETLATRHFTPYLFCITIFFSTHTRNGLACIHENQLEDEVFDGAPPIMADRRQGPPVPPKRNIDANGLTAQFEDLLRTRRLNDLADRSQSQRRTESPEPLCHASFSSRTSSQQTPRPPTEQPNTLPAYSSLRNHPKIATPPQDPASLRFCSQLRALSVRPTKYENPGLLDEALGVIPLDRIYGEAEDESSLLQAEAASIGGNAKPKWGHQDCVVRALLRYAGTPTKLLPLRSLTSWLQMVQRIFLFLRLQPSLLVLWYADDQTRIHASVR